MDDIRELSLDELEQVSGGVIKKVNTGTTQNAAIKSAPGNAKVVASLPNGSVVNTISDLVYDEATGRNWVRVEYTDAHGKNKKGWIAASIVGMKR